MAGYLNPEVVSNCNITESKFYILSDNNILTKKILNLLNSNDIKLYLDLCKYSGFNSRIVIESITYDGLTLDMNLVKKLLNKNKFNEIDNLMKPIDNLINNWNIEKELNDFDIIYNKAK
jgi:hypothetical protein